MVRCFSEFGTSRLIETSKLPGSLIIHEWSKSVKSRLPLYHGLYHVNPFHYFLKNQKHTNKKKRAMYIREGKSKVEIGVPLACSQTLPYSFCCILSTHMHVQTTHTHARTHARTHTHTYTHTCTHMHAHMPTHTHTHTHTYTHATHRWCRAAGLAGHMPVQSSHVNPHVSPHMLVLTSVLTCQSSRQTSHVSSHVSPHMSVLTSVFTC